ncbi:MAG: SnoaL-like domain [Solirubrobacteraceae bacterium]|jgi:ketosteroid isomerase-like protein|nr:SnoaL-like domain [Solirubrobacteraceae bacterium]
MTAVRALVDAWNRLDEEAFVALCDPDIEFVSILSRVEGHAYHGHEGVRRYFADIRSLGRNHIELEALVQGDDATVVAREHVTGAGRVSEASLDIRTGNVFTFKDGRVVRLLAFMPPERALDEVGLSDWGDSDVTGGEPRE